MKRTTLPFLLVLAVAACERDAPVAEDEANATTNAATVDSVLPMPVMLERFRAGLVQPQRMTSGAATRDELVERIVTALERSDTMAFEPLAMGVEEFAWLYYPTAPTAQPPYELPPGVAWLQIQQRNRDGVLRALREFGGMDLSFGGYRCAAEPTSEGENRMWNDCVVTLARAGEPARELRLFGTILERDGRFAVVSFTNDF